MNVISSKRVYDKVSLMYNDLMRTIDYEHWAEYILSIARKFVRTNPATLEIAAGNCKTANIISRKIQNLVVTDISLPMLCLDSVNNLNKICCNMLALPFKIKFDFVYCTFDSINYLKTKRELMALLREVNNILTEDGVFTFDISLENNSRSFINEILTEDNYGEIKYRRVSRYNRMNKIHSNIFYINYNGMKLKEIHKQKIYDLESYLDCFNEMGLFVKKCYDAFTFKPGSSKSLRVQFVVGKKSE